MPWEKVTEAQRSPYRAMSVERHRNGRMDVSCDDCGYIQMGEFTLEQAKQEFREHRRRIH